MVVARLLPVVSCRNCHKHVDGVLFLQHELHICNLSGVHLCNPL